VTPKSTLYRLALMNEAQHDAICWASQAEHPPTLYSFVKHFHAEKKK